MNQMPEHAYATVEAGRRGEIWHRRLGHIGKNGMRQLARAAGKEIRGLRVSEKECDVCIQGKQCRKSFPASDKRA